ncbi:MAG: SDR family NAD(P)-dependent oxidoreductase [Stellaceae bacterium]
MTGTGRPVALVTGASSGIGADLARELAHDGHDLVLTARRAPPMRALAAEIEAAGAAAVVIPADLSQPGAAAALTAAIDERGLTIDVLINNAGLGAAGRFDRSDPVRIAEMLNVNIVALTELSRLALPGMVARRRGRVMLVASTAGFLPGPGMAVYFATKAYVLSLGEALAQELRGTGVTVTTLCPGATATEFFQVAGSADLRRGMMSPAAVARIGWRGLKSGRRVVVAGLANKVQALAARFGPHTISVPVAAALMSRR